MTPVAKAYGLERGDGVDSESHVYPSERRWVGMEARLRLDRALTRARYAAIGAAAGAAVGGLFGRSTASTGGAVGAMVGATVGEVRSSADGLIDVRNE